jgi:hypothetical protein
MYAVNGVEENGIQVGETWGALVDDGDTVWRETFNAPFSPAVGSIVWAEVARDPSGIDNGGLDSFQPTGDLAGWRDVVTARVQIRKYQGA